MDSIAKARHVAYAMLAAPDLDQMERFLVDFGLQVALRTPDRLYMRAAGTAPYVHVTEKGDPAFLGMAFEVGSEEELHRLAQLPEASAVHTLDRPGGGLCVRLREPNGYIVEVVFGIHPAPPLDVTSYALNTEQAPALRAGSSTRLAIGPSRVKRIGHVVLASTRLRDTVGWFQRTLGLLPSDEVFFDSPDNIVGSFNRCDQGDTYVDHHSVMVLQGDVTGLNHLAFEVTDIDDVFTGHEHLQAGGYEHMFGVGRHLLGSQVFDYWADPWGRVHEHWTDTDLLNADADCQRMDIREGFVSQWGGEPPQKLLVRVSP